MPQTLTLLGQLIFLSHRDVILIKQDTAESIRWKFKSYFCKTNADILILYNKLNGNIPNVAIINSLTLSYNYINVYQENSKLKSNITFKEYINRSLKDMNIKEEDSIKSVIYNITRYVDNNNDKYSVYWLVVRGIIVPPDIGRSLYTRSLEGKGPVDLIKFIREDMRQTKWKCSNLELDSNSLEMYTESPIFQFNKLRTIFPNINIFWKEDIEVNEHYWNIGRNLPSKYKGKTILDLRTTKKLPTGTNIFDSIYFNVVLRYCHTCVRRILNNPTYIGNPITQSLRSKWPRLHIPVNGFLQSKRLRELSHIKDLGKSFPVIDLDNAMFSKSLDIKLYGYFIDQISKFHKDCIDVPDNLIFNLNQMGKIIGRMRFIEIAIDKFVLSSSTLENMITKLMNLQSGNKSKGPLFTFVMESIYPKLEDTLESLNKLQIYQLNKLASNPIYTINGFKACINEYRKTLNMKHITSQKVPKHIEEAIPDIIDLTNIKDPSDISTAALASSSNTSKVITSTDIVESSFG